MKDLISGQSIEIFKAVNIMYLNWFPDGSKVHFWASTESGLANYSVSRLGGAPISSQPGLSNTHAWSPDGSLSAFTEIGSEDIKIKNNLTGDISSIPTNVSFDELRSIDWSPLGNFLLFLTLDEEGTHFIWTMTPEGKILKQVFKDRIDIRMARWSPRGDAIYFMTDDGLWKIRISPTTGEVKDPAFKFLSGLQPGDYFSITKDGKQLYYAKALSYSNLWRFGVEDNEDGKSMSPQQLTTGTMFCESPSVSPNGKNIAFSRGDGTKSNIYMMPLDGGEPQQITFLDSLNLGPVWSSDAREIAFASTEGGSAEIWKIRLFDKKLSHFEGTKIDYQLHLCWSPGPNILFQTLGMTNIHVLDPKTSKVVPLVKDAQGWMFSPRYSPDTKFIAFSWNRPPHKTWLFSSDGKVQKNLGGEWDEGHNPIGWSSDGNWLYVLDAFSDPKSINRVDAQTGEFENVIETTFNLMGPFWRRGVSMTPDGKNFIVTVYENYSDVWVVKNFDPDIK
jgi:Tol biopolymer transport system component